MLYDQLSVRRRSKERIKPAEARFPVNLVKLLVGEVA